VPHDFEADIEAVNRVEAVATILDVVCRTTGMGFAAVARVTTDRWIACRVVDKIAFGLEPGGELAVATTICNEIRQSGEAVVIDHVAEDAVYCGHPTPAMYGFQSYISMPIIRKDGSFFGTLCAIDPQPARLKTPEIIGTFSLFAELIAFHLDAADQLAASQRLLGEERKVAELREQFIAVLGHDLRNPVAAVDSGLKLLRLTELQPKAARVVDLIQDSIGRMGAMIDDVLDFARGRLGSGIPVKRLEEVALEPMLVQVVDELRAVWPERTIATSFALDRQVRCDSARIAQLFSNLLANALAHGDPVRPVEVEATTAGDRFELSVSNAGEPIRAATLEHLFQPFYRGQSDADRRGLGLGLYIASQIAEAHGGTLTASSTPEQTRFSFFMPIA
jgi:signal transduction histidine kinase